MEIFVFIHHLHEEPVLSCIEHAAVSDWLPLTTLRLPVTSGTPPEARLRLKDVRHVGMIPTTHGIFSLKYHPG